jgi:hypothetical protein
VAGEGLKLELDGILPHAAGARFRSTETRPPRTKSQKVALKVASRASKIKELLAEMSAECVGAPQSK